MSSQVLRAAALQVLPPVVVVVVLIALAAVLTLAPPAHATTPEPPRFTVRQEIATTGTQILQPLLEPQPVPINRRFDQLEPAQRALLAADYPKLAPDDEPPFPLDGLEPLLQPIARAQARLNARGTLVLQVAVDAAGEPQSVAVLQAGSDAMTQVAAAVLMQQRFKPAVCNGQPCAMNYVLRLGFIPQRVR